MSQDFKFALALAVALVASPARGGALLMPEGQGQAIVTTTFADASKAYDSQGRLIRTPSYRKFEIAGYIEYGAADWLTVVADGSGFDFRGAWTPQPLSAAAGVQYEGAGLGALGGRVRLGEFGGVYVSLQASVRAASKQARTFLDIKSPEQFDARLQALRSFELWGLPWFLDAQFGYRTRGQNGDEARADLTLGVRPRSDILLMAQSFSAFSPWAGSGNGFSAQKFELSGVYDLNRTFSFQLGVVDAPLGVNSPAERGIVSGVWARF